jgi:hypothetical protein
MEPVPLYEALWSAVNRLADFLRFDVTGQR